MTELASRGKYKKRFFFQLKKMRPSHICNKKIVSNIVFWTKLILSLVPEGIWFPKRTLMTRLASC